MTVIETGQRTHPGCASPEKERLRVARAQLSDWLDDFVSKHKGATIDDIDAAERLRDKRRREGQQ